MKLNMNCLLIFALVAQSAADVAGDFPTMLFDDGYTHLFGGDNLMVFQDGKIAHITLDERTGSGFVSHDIYRYGYFSASIKLPADYTAGVVVAFYMSNGDMYEKNHDEIDFEFLGNIRGKEWRIQTNIYGNGSTSRGREERYDLGFDPSDEFHQYAILWTDSLIVFYIDDIPIREIKRTEEMGGDFPSKPMSLYATIWDGSGWATNGGKYKVNYKYAPYIAEFSNFILHGCAVDPIEGAECEDAPRFASMSSNITSDRRADMARFRTSYMKYSYCYDRARYKSPQSECVIVPTEAARLMRADPVRFGGAPRRHRGRRRRRSRPENDWSASI
ncbi:probable xyloglucan endotransglucosylase/hydrolase protein 27 [Andrographis paniculata]|uniref:probable xyloglucan endotransglucosylase/hydrolase protein 27 n=1 Tax=Andrographis paniculata TaxID=175694 RepID=UPI0021E94591|nr:probable xyloglucan endotransglucosylase/hydrolase protein 27 [Andrographis paniculata]